MAGMQTYLELFCSVFLFFYKEKTCSNFYLTQGTGHLFAGASSYERANSSHQSFATYSIPCLNSGKTNRNAEKREK